MKYRLSARDNIALGRHEHYEDLDASNGQPRDQAPTRQTTRCEIANDTQLGPAIVEASPTEDLQRTVEGVNRNMEAAES